MHNYASRLYGNSKSVLLFDSFKMSDSFKICILTGKCCCTFCDVVAVLYIKSKIKNLISMVGFYTNNFTFFM